MTIITTIARILLGLMFVVFGLNGFVHFIPTGPPPAGLAGEFLGALVASHFVLFVSGIQLLAGTLLLAGRYIMLAMVLLGAVLSNILVFHITMNPQGLSLALVATLLWFVTALSLRTQFALLFSQHVETPAGRWSGGFVHTRTA